MNIREKGREIRKQLGNQCHQPPKIWGKEKQMFPKEQAAFTRCHDRVRDGRCPSIEWPRNPEGFLEFLNEVGLIPSHLQRPSIGRKNHSKGYIKDNIQWEEYMVNSVKKGN